MFGKSVVFKFILLLFGWQELFVNGAPCQLPAFICSYITNVFETCVYLQFDTSRGLLLLAWDPAKANGCVLKLLSSDLHRLHGWFSHLPHIRVTHTDVKKAIEHTCDELQSPSKRGQGVEGKLHSKSCFKYRAVCRQADSYIHKGNLAEDLAALSPTSALIMMIALCSVAKLRGRCVSTQRHLFHSACLSTISVKPWEILSWRRRGEKLSVGKTNAFGDGFWKS